MKGVKGSSIQLSKRKLQSVADSLSTYYHQYDLLLKKYQKSQKKVMKINVLDAECIKSFVVVCSNF